MACATDASVRTNAKRRVIASDSLPRQLKISDRQHTEFSPRSLSKVHAISMSGYCLEDLLACYMYHAELPVSDCTQSAVPCQQQEKRVSLLKGAADL